MVTFLLIALLAGSIGTASARSLGEEGDHFEGDISGISPALFFSRAGQLSERFRWPNRLVPYAFDSSYPQNLRDTFVRAINYIAENTCIDFTPRTNERDYVRVYAGNGCHSSIGRVGGEQEISLPRSCSIGTHVHEVIHAIGFFHEQSRPDWDDFVRIHEENIEPNASRNFRKTSTSQVSTFGVQYDFGSIMHYPAKAFSRNGRDTITTIPAGQPIGQRNGMSQRDILKINRMYKCE